MDVSDLLGLPYPESDDPQAIALYMQDLAFKLEDLLTAVDASVDAFNARPCAYWTNTAGSITANSSTSVPWDTNTPLAYQGTTVQPAGPSTSPRFPEPREGLWLVGASFPTLTATTPNVDTFRQIQVSAGGNGAQFQQIAFMGPRNLILDNVGPQGNPNWVSDQALETNTGAPGAPLSSYGMAWIPPGAPVDPLANSIGRISVAISNTNTSSAIPIGAGTGFLYAVWLGYGTEQIVQV